MQKPNLQNLFQQGQKAYQENNLPLAWNAFQEVLKIQPHNPDALHILGIISSQQGDHHQGIEYLQRAISRNANPTFFNNLGLIFAKIQNWNHSIHQYRMALKLAPDFNHASYNLGIAYRQLKQYDAAIQLYKKLSKKNPRDDKAFFNWGGILIAQGKYKSALPILQQCIEINPSHHGAWKNMAFLHEHWENWIEAEKSFKKSCELQPQDQESFLDLVSFYQKTGNYTAIEDFQQQIKHLSDQNPWMKWHLALLEPIIFDSNIDILDYRKKCENLLQEFQSNPPNISPQLLNKFTLKAPFILHYTGMDETKLRTDFGHFFENYFNKIRQAHSRKTKVANTIPHIGFVVTSGHEGVFLKCMKGIVNQLNTDKYKITIVCSEPNGPAIFRDSIPSDKIQLLPIPKEIELAQEIMELANFDLLYYWEIGTDNLNYFLPFLGIAPIQCTSWGWPLTSGIPTVQYFLSSEKLETPESEKFYTEKLIQFKRLPTYYFRPELPIELKSKAHFGLPEDRTIYACVQNYKKIHPDMDQVFAKILEKDTHGILVILGSKHDLITDRLKNRISKHIPDASSRLYVMPRLSQEEYMSILQLSDVVLDTFYYNGGANSVADLFATKTPYVTYQWKFHRGRYGAAAYLQANIENAPIALNPEEYTDLAIKLGTSASYRSSISAQMEKMSYEIFEDTEAVSELENFFDSVLNGATLIPKNEDPKDDFVSIKSSIPEQISGDKDAELKEKVRRPEQGRQEDDNVDINYKFNEDMLRPENHPFYCTYTPNIPELLLELNCSLAITTYQAGKLIIISPLNKHQLIQLPRDFKKAMGLCIEGRKMAVATKDEVVVLADAKGLSGSFPLHPPNTYDSLYIPRAVYFTGEVDIHDMHWSEEGLKAIITRFSCIGLIDDSYSIRPVWKPKFIKSLEPTDNCHLNGMATYQGKEKYVSAFGMTDAPKGWRKGAINSGIIMDIESQEVIIQGLSMPHSPRIYDNHLYVLLSGTGELIEVDVKSGKYETIIQLEGFVRGMCKWGDYLFIGLSRIRESSTTFRDLPIRHRNINCGIEVVHLPTGLSVGNIRYKNDVQELYDIQILHDSLRPGILNHTENTHRMALNTPESDFWSQPQPEKGAEGIF